MATFTAFIFTILVTLNIANAQSNITQGSSLTPTGSTISWPSPSGLYAFGFYPQTLGYAIGIFIAGAGISQPTVVWTASRDTLPISNNSTLSFTADGRLIVDQTPGQPIDITGVAGASRASMQDSGNFVLYGGSDGTTPLWQSFDHPTDTLLAGQRLVVNQTLFSSVSETDQSIGVFKLILQEDGNLVQQPNVGTGETPFTSYWDSQTVGSGPNVTLNLDSNGHLYLLQNSSIYIKNLTELRRGDRSERAVYRMTIDVDGIFRLYRLNLSNMNESITYESSSYKCAAKGICGVNGYCEVVNDVARCRCLPGFEMVDPVLRSSGCRRNYTSEKCKIVDDGRNSLFRMTRLDNVEWEDVPYAAIETSTQEECSSACLDDSICEVARYGGRSCKFQRLPLKYMQVAGSDYTDVGWIKVCESSFDNGNDRTNPSNEVKKVRRDEIFVIGVSLISFSVLVLLILGAVVCRAKGGWAYRNVYKHVNVQLFDDIGPRAFSYGELEGITDGFIEELGRGSFGIVYKGVIDGSNKAIAVKKLKEELAQDGEREFQTEMKVIGRTHHRNLVRLLGYCCEGPERLLVMEYMNKSLSDLLFDKESKPSWEERIRMAMDIARGIQYLHEECETVIIHCDIKPQNILMDEYGRAKISDFGLAKLLERNQTKTFTFIRGTRGYVAPEWHKKLPVTVKVDVYSFGIVLLEILCCRRHVENDFSVNEAILEEWVLECYEKDELWRLVNDEDVDKREMEEMVRIGVWCIQEEPSLRPSMRKVLLMLQGIVEIPLPPNTSSFTKSLTKINIHTPRPKSKRYPEFIRAPD
ncbi:hypothetical protein OSB04_018156 [Centaurea solstitialis]|uniref:Receptor-like serine/threonine-protein kinase n=1 Tax=Centaurea solstitialis TaxID=347529 RepID=A0AA38TF69_9ASTR|nr:hypothetical protein OSB04_018156 [Centaurea solstitialis]